MAAEPPPTATGLPVLGNTLDYMQGHLDFLEKVYEECGDIALVNIAAVGTYCIVLRPEYFIRTAVTVYRYDRTPSCGRHRPDVQQPLSVFGRYASSGCSGRDGSFRVTKPVVTDGQVAAAATGMGRSAW